jgi:RNA polymerase sigma-70 factor (ECF subfamily)
MTHADDRQAAFVQLLREHERIVWHVARLYSRGRDDQRDLAQEICLQLWRSFARYDAARKFSTWMYRVALNVAISHRRSARARDDATEPLEEELAQTWTDSAQDAALRERLRELHALIAQLGPLDRALMLLLLDECSYAEIAEVMGLSVTNVATKISRLKQRLRLQMKGEQ